MASLLPGTEVRARSLRSEAVLSQQLGEQMLSLRGLRPFRGYPSCPRLTAFHGRDGGLRGRELDLLHPFVPIEPVARAFEPTKAAPLANWLVYNEAFLFEQALAWVPAE
jgi:hypothetical protein